MKDFLMAFSLLCVLALPAAAQNNFEFSAEKQNGSYSTPNHCAYPVEVFKGDMMACTRSYGGGYCSKLLWGSFKNKYPNCKTAGFLVCVNYCAIAYGGHYCATNVCN